MNVRGSIGSPAVALLFLLVVGAVAGCAGRPSGAAAGRASPPPVASIQVDATDRTISGLQAKLRDRPDDWASLDALAAAYLQKVREVGDPAYYPKVESILQTVLSHDTKDANATTLMGSLLLAQHRFADALDWGRRAEALSPFASRPLGIVADAQVELGQYSAATDTIQRMVDMRPDLSSYARVSYIRELYGDVPGALHAMREAADAGGPVPENSAYTRVLLGNLFFNEGQLGQAEQQYEWALAVDPGYIHAVAAMGRVRAALGRYVEAIGLYRRAIDIYPAPDYVIALGDVYQVTGEAEKASEMYDLAEAEFRLYQANGVDLDAELALYAADHRRNLPEALAAAQRAMRDRPGIRSADVLGWTLLQSGDARQALATERRALRLGTRDALLVFHLGMIEARLGMKSEARSHLATAIQINPYFSLLHGAEAKRVLGSLL